MGKLYDIVTSFIDIHTDEEYRTNSEPVYFSDERVEEIRKTEQLLGYPLIKEHEGESENNTLLKESKHKNKKNN